MKICETCQSLIVNFYLLTITSERSQENFSLETSKRAKSKPIEEYLDGPVVMHTIDIVESFIENQTVQIFIEDDARLIIERTLSSRNVKQEEDADVITEDLPKEINTKFSEEGSLGNGEDRNDINAEWEDTESNISELERDVEILEDGSREDTAACESFVLNDIEFVERTPEYLVNAYKPSRRLKNPDSWIRNRQKNSRAKGEEYITKNGRVVAAKRMQSPCKENCRLKCYKNITEEDRRRNFESYWALASFILQRKYIYEHHRTVPVQRRRFRSTEGGKPREYSSQYFLDKSRNDGSFEQVHVCEKMFLKTFDICRNIVSYLHKKVQTGKVQDLRGISKRKLSLGHEAAIAQIKANPFYHIDTPMPITKMYSLYHQACLEKGIEAVKNHTYRKLFAEYNECEFLKREKSLCSICDKYCQTSEEEKKSLEDNYQRHLQEDDKCSQRAKGRIRAARNSKRKKNLRQHDQESQLDDIIVEEHLNYEHESDQNFVQ